ncbi:hypothetical protein [Pseudacidovorax sp. RU35E]|jgi:hypothetical protein|uniref:hypothetical protein n=1 Tax=Pseudacidovorax sp. RU35E TaxID=1907403 RepID=UPI00117AF111|nr:hypothetical protein [Pseudacidovorax sp. RU35E]
MEPVEAKTAADSDWDKRCDILYKSWVQVRYHRKRQRFFDLVDRATKALTLVLGASLFGPYVGKSVSWIGTAISAIGLMALVFSYGDRKQLHKEMAERAAGIVRSIESVPAGQLTAANTATWAADFAELVSKAPPPLKTLTMMCEREQSTADGHPNHVAPRPLGRRVFAHVF